MFEPQPLTNNAVSSVLNFSALQETRASLTGKTVIVGSVTYTFYTNVFPESVDASTLLDNRDIASAICDAINADATARGVTFSAALIPNSNPQAEAYVSGSIVTVVSRTGAAVFVGGTSGASASGGSGASGGPNANQVRDAVRLYTATATPQTLASTSITKSFDVEALDGDLLVGFTAEFDAGTFYKIFSGFGSTFVGTATDFKIKSATGSVAVQVKEHY